MKEQAKKGQFPLITVVSTEGILYGVDMIVPKHMGEAKHKNSYAISFKGGDNVCQAEFSKEEPRNMAMAKILDFVRKSMKGEVEPIAIITLESVLDEETGEFDTKISIDGEEDEDEEESPNKSWPKFSDNVKIAILPSGNRG